MLLKEALATKSTKTFPLAFVSKYKNIQVIWSCISKDFANLAKSQSWGYNRQDRLILPEPR